MRRRGWITAIALAVCAMLLSMGAFADDVSYIKYEYTYSESGGSYLMGEKAFLSDDEYTIVDSDYEYSAPWTGAYVVVGNVEITERIKVSGEADLILTDGCTLTASAGISVTKDNTLNIYGQSEGTGALTATGVTASGTKGAAGIGGEYATDEASLCGTINIHGGVITALGENYNDALSGVKGMGGAGIGNGYSTNGGLPVSGEINIFDGKVTATGATQGGAGIGGGTYGKFGAINIRGGEITATGGSYGSVSTPGSGGAAGIGGGNHSGSVQSVEITGGDITATGGENGAAGIGRAAALGWITGYNDGTFRPDNKITRAEAMTMINRVLNRDPVEDDDLHPDMRTWTDNRPGTWYYFAVQEATNSHEYTRPDAHEDWTAITADPDWTRYQ